MKSLKKAVLFGFLVWLVPFVVAVIIFPINQSDRILFESIMPVVLTISAVIFSNAYLKKVNADYLKEGILLGLMWFAISILIDLSLFMYGPMKMTFIDYVKDIGLTYIIIPTVTIGLASAKKT